MAYKSPNEYKNTKHSYPADRLPSEQKTQQWFLSICEALWGDYVSNRCLIPFDNASSQRSIEELRAYATGTQDMAKIKGFLLKKADPNNPNSSFSTSMNISWQGYDIMPKMLDIMRSYNSKIDYEVNATAIDDDSLDLKETDKEYIKHYLNPAVKGLMDRAGYKPKMSIDPQEVGAQNEGDIDLLIAAGGYNLQTEIAAQVVSNKTKKESYFPVIQDMCFDDLIIIAKAALKSYIDKTTNVVKLRYVDPKNLIIKKSEFIDFRDASKIAELRYMTIRQIREESNMEESKLIQLANDFSFANPDFKGFQSSTGFNETYYRNQNSSMGVDPINDVLIPVMDLQLLSCDIDSYLSSTRESNGAYQFKKVPYDYEVTDKALNKGDRKRTMQVIRKYEALWIIGTDMFIKCGPAEYVKYKGEKGARTPELDFHVVQTLNISIIERCIALVDDINLALFKRRNALATLPPAPRMIIEQGLLDNVEFNGTQQEPEDLIRTFEEKGILVVNRMNEFGKPVVGNGGGKVIDFVPSGVIEDITLFTNEIMAGKEAIKEVTGVNDIVAANTPSTEVGLGVSKLAAVAASNALFPTFNAFKYLFEPSFEDVVGKWQLVVSQNEKRIEHVPIGSNTAQVFLINKDFARSKFSLKIDMVIGESERQMLLQEIAGLKAARRANGDKGGITGAQYLKLYELINSGNRKLAMFILAQIEKSQADRDLAISREAQQATFDGQIKTGQATEAAKQKTYQIEGSVKSFTALIVEASKRKTILTTKLLETPTVEGAPPVNTDLIQAEIAKCDEEIASLMAMQQPQQEQQQGGQPQMAIAS